MEKQKILQADYLDIVFDNRNKSYGSYDLRKKYPDRARRALVVVLLSVSAICAVPVIASNINYKPKIDATSFADPIKVDNLPKHLQPEPKPAPKPDEAPKPSEPAPVAPTVENVIPIIVEDDPTNNQPPIVDSLIGKESGAKNSEGDPNGKVADNGQPHGDGDGKDKEDGNGGGGDNKPKPWVEEMPSFDGDVYGYLSRNIRYPQAAIDISLEGKAIVEFVVNEDGKITDVKIAKSAGKILDTEAIRVVSGMPKWKPGKQGGKAVKVYYNLPVTFVLN